MRFNKDFERGLTFDQVDMMPLIANLPTETRIVDAWDPESLSFVKKAREFTISGRNNISPLRSLVAA